MICRTNIVECLRNEGVNPEVIDTKYLNSYYPSYGINYEITTNNYFHSPTDPDDTWTLDFKRVVSITSYQFKAGTGGNWIKNWNIYIKKGSRWILVDPHQNDIDPGDDIHYLKKVQSTRYLKIEGGKTEYGYKCLVFYYIKLFGFSTRVDNCKYTGKPHFRISKLVCVLIFIIS